VWAENDVLGRVEKLADLLVSSEEKGHRHQVEVWVNPDTVVLWFREENGHVHVASVPLVGAYANGGVVASSEDVDHQHTIRIEFKQKT